MFPDCVSISLFSFHLLKLTVSSLDVLPEAFRPSTRIFSSNAIRRRPWRKDEARSSLEWWCGHHTIPPEHEEELKKTEKVSAFISLFDPRSRCFQSVIEAIKSVTMLTMEVVIKILESGILDYVPIPGLSLVAKSLVRIWNVVQGISVSDQYPAFLSKLMDPPRTIAFVSSV
jgi:hypothetical protein